MRYKVTVVEDEREKQVGIPMSLWGKDHWSVFAYVHYLCVNHPGGFGEPEPEEVQANLNRHPQFVLSRFGTVMDGAKWGIRLKDGVELPGPDYDEYDCLDDAEREGLMDNKGTGLHRSYKMTNYGNEVAGELMAHKANGGNFADFIPSVVGETEEGG